MTPIPSHANCYQVMIRSGQSSSVATPLATLVVIAPQIDRRDRDVDGARSLWASSTREADGGATWTPARSGPGAGADRALHATPMRASSRRRRTPSGRRAPDKLLAALDGRFRRPALSAGSTNTARYQRDHEHGHHARGDRPDPSNKAGMRVASRARSAGAQSLAHAPCPSQPIVTAARCAIYRGPIGHALVQARADGRHRSSLKWILAFGR